ncbi:MAG: DUF4184 family protein [Proteobacteria bacterium]|nr:DUF4184 family protein [Pseudomonadota bacterium]
MPFTPLHFGYGALLHSAAPGRISFLAFCLANVVIDLEPLYYMVSGQYPIHRFFHTLPGATLAGAAVIAVHALLRRQGLAGRLPNLLGWKSLTTRNVISGALLGAVTHVFFDAVMHDDLRPWAPLSEANPLLRLVSIDELNLSCFFAAVAGAVVLGLRHFRRGTERGG